MVRGQVTVRQRLGCTRPLAELLGDLPPAQGGPTPPTTPEKLSRSLHGRFGRLVVVGALVLGALMVPLLGGSQRAFAVGSVSDNFNRANGSLGAGWTDMSDGGLAISSQVVVGTKSTYSGDIRTGETYSSDQSSQIEVTSTQLSGGQWLGAAVRAQNKGQSLYLGLYFWNNGNPELMLYKRIGGNWTQLGSSSFQGALAAGTQLNLSVAGSKLTFAQNGVTRITATDTSLTGGAPGIMAYGTPKGDNWVGVGTTGTTYTVGGTISGLTGTAVLENNAGNDLSTSTNGSFTFSTALAQGSAYNVIVKTNPAGQTCSVTNPSGTIATANVTNVSISCVTNVVPTYTVGGTISGLTGTAVLENNAGNDLSTSTNGAFTFSTALAQGSAYNVTVKTNPAGQTCSVTNPSGTIATANVTNVSISCVTQVAGGFSVQYQSTDANNIEYFSYTDPDDGYDTQTLRVLIPTNPAAGVAHNFLYVLPVETGVGSSFGDGMDTMAALDAEDQYNLTIIEPSFSDDPWYADNPNDPNLQYETFMTSELVPWVTANLSTTGTEQNWLIGFSKSGIGGQDLLLKHPDLFQLAASWDFPADMSAYDEYGSSSADNYGTDANFQANYRLTSAFLDAHKAPFMTNNRIWIGGYYAFQTDVSDYDALLTSEGIQHTLGPMQPIAHTWDSGWVPAALAALYQDSIQLH
jgi:predicted transcriptional regulator